MTFESDADSRDYLFTFPIDGPESIPSDFEFHPGEIRAGVFLPRDDPDWFGRRSYPPRLLLLCPGCILLVSHPKSNNPVQRIELANLVSVESAHVLLLGSIRLMEADRTIEIRYNRRSSGPVERWLGCLRDSLLDDHGPSADIQARRFGENIDFKFENANAAELARTEVIQTSWFSPPAETETRYWIFSRRRAEPGNLLSMTDRRILWITDQVFKSYERYGYTARYAPLGELDCVSVAGGGQRLLITISFRRGADWSVPIRAGGASSAIAFVKAANQALHQHPIRL